VPIRWYDPTGAPPAGFFIYVHGGGFALGDLTTHDALCRRLATESRLVVIGVDYRLAPEHPFPAGLNDVLAVTRWAQTEATRRGVRLAIGGDSAGGNLATVACLAMLRNGEVTPVAQALVYPNTDYQFERASMLTYGDGYAVSVDEMRFLWSLYVKDEAARLDEFVAPMRASSLAGMPPALIVTAEFDFLLDEDIAYASRLAADGVRVSHVHFPGVMHGFLNTMGLFEAADQAVVEIGNFLRQQCTSQNGSE
jgi:acetyl esterase